MAEIASRITPPVEVEVVIAMRVRLIELGMIEKPVPQRTRPQKSKLDPDNFDLFGERLSA